MTARTRQGGRVRRRRSMLPPTSSLVLEPPETLHRVFGVVLIGGHAEGHAPVMPSHSRNQTLRMGVPTSVRT